LERSIANFRRRIKSLTLWGHYAEYRRIRLEYRRLYPNGKLWLYQGILTYAAFALLLLVALGWRFGIFK
jgi:hypothetical protein